MNGTASTDIFSADQNNFLAKALAVFRYQFNENELYRSYCRCLGKSPDNVRALTQIPFLPVSMFKTHRVLTPADVPVRTVFESSGTTGTINSKHFVAHPKTYEQSFIRCFEKFYGNPERFRILGLLPSYLERANSSLVYMVSKLIELSRHRESGFYLDGFGKLAGLLKNAPANRTTLLIGVTFALMDFAEAFSMDLHRTVVMETGGMKGRKKESTREEVHGFLKSRWNLASVHSEYGMTELLSQAYSRADGIFETPPWMRVLVRAEDDPLMVTDAGGTTVTGIINVIDLANAHSCSFIGTDDAGVLLPDGRFRVQGRVDHSDIRGCSLLAP